MDGECVAGFFKEDAVVADPQAEETFELAGERLDPARSGVGVAVDGFEDRHRNVPWDGADLSRDFRFKVNPLHPSFLAPRICSMVKPSSATTCSKGMPWPPFRKYSQTS